MGLQNNINIYRKALIMKRICGVTEIMKFIPCSYPRAKVIRDEILQEIAIKKKLPPGNGKVFTDYLLPYINADEKTIFKYSEIEEKESN